MIFVAWIAKMVHPKIIVIHRVVNAVWAVELQGDYGAAQKVKKHGVVRSTTDAGIDDVIVTHRLALVFQLALYRSRFQPGIVETSAAGILYGVTSFDQHRRKGAGGPAMEVWPGGGGVHIE